MRIDHVAIYTPDLERAKSFYCKYFGFIPGEKYFNPVKQFESYFLYAEDHARLEIMRLPDLAKMNRLSVLGYAHIALGVGSETKVVELTETLVSDGYKLVSGPRRTGDGYFESAIQDPDGNLVEITV